MYGTTKLLLTLQNIQIMVSKLTLITKKRILIGLVLLSLSAYGYLLHENKQLDEGHLAKKESVLKNSELVPSIIVIKRIYESACKYVK